MPLQRGYEIVNGERKGFFQWGNQKKYYFPPGDKPSRERAKQQALKQAQAIRASGYGG